MNMEELKRVQQLLLADGVNVYIVKRVTDLINSFQITNMENKNVYCLCGYIKEGHRKSFW